MHKPDNATTAVAMPAIGGAGPQSGWFDPGNPGTGQKGTILDASFMNDLLQNLKELSDQAGVTWTKGRKEDIYDSIMQLITDALPNLGWPPGFIHDLMLSRPASDRITVAAGHARDNADDANLTLGAAITKQIDTAWAAGDGNGGFGVGGGVQANTWYHVFLIEDGAGGVDAGFDTSINATNLLAASGYDRYAYLGSVLTDGSSGIIDFVQLGDFFLWKDPPLDVNSAAISGTASLLTLSVPPGVKVFAYINLQVTDGSEHYEYVSSPDVNDEAPSATAAPLYMLRQQSGDNSDGATFFVPTNTSKQVRARANVAIDDFQLATLGWFHPRGRTITV